MSDLESFDRNGTRIVGTSTREEYLRDRAVADLVHVVQPEHREGGDW